MMKIFNNPAERDWKTFIKRPQLETEFLASTVRNTLDMVKRSGNKALQELTVQYDKINIDSFEVSQTEIEEAEKLLSSELKQAINIASKNIETFHTAQRRETVVIETMPGVKCWRKAVPINKVGIYIPGGTAPLFSTVLMLGIPAKLAGCKDVILCTPPDAQGNVHPAIIYAAQCVGISKLFKVGGAQAIGAMAYGTESIPNVYKIFGPGNQYVTKAKQLISEEGIAIDMPAGPSEVLVFADETADPSFVASDLLSQAEHGTDSQVMLVLSDEELLFPIEGELQKQLNLLPRKSIAKKVLENSSIVILNDREKAISFINEYAPEHLIINVKDRTEVAQQVANAGSVFIGNYSPEAVGDYASGTNHTLPTNGYARAYAGVSLESFMKYITFQELSQEGLATIGPIVETLAEAEELTGHKMAVSIRLNKLKGANTST